jgi:hypothetical protein
MIVLDAELNSLSINTSFNGGHQARNQIFYKILVLWGCCRNTPYADTLLNAFEDSLCCCQAELHQLYHPTL